MSKVVLILIGMFITLIDISCINLSGKISREEEKRQFR